MKEIEKQISKCLDKSEIKSVLVAVSGGADSVALLCGCSRIGHRQNLKIEAVNCNFNLRGEESKRDSQFVADLCGKLGIKLHSLEYDTTSWLREHPGTSMEMACRELRYSDFRRIAAERKLDRIAVAHNSDDDIETMVLNLLRGSGTRGLRGMEEDTGTIVRPLLGIPRKDIEDYLLELGQDYVTDSSNHSSAYRRNYIRRDVIPLLEARWPGARKALSHSIAILKEESKIVEDHYSAMIEALQMEDGSLNVYDRRITKGIIWKWIEPKGGNPKIAAEILKAVGEQFGERRWPLGKKHLALLERDRLRLVIPGNEKEISLKWECLANSREMMQEVKGNRNHRVAYFPEGPDAYSVRKPKTGDRMSPLGMKGSRLVSDIISDARLNMEAKTKVRIVERKKDGEIIWIPGLKRSRCALIDSSMKTIWKSEEV